MAFYLWNIIYVAGVCQKCSLALIKAMTFAVELNIHIVIFDEGVRVLLEADSAPLAHVTATVRMEDEDSGGQAGIINMTMVFLNHNFGMHMENWSEQQLLNEIKRINKLWLFKCLSSGWLKSLELFKFYSTCPLFQQKWNSQSESTTYLNSMGRIAWVLKIKKIKLPAN